MIGKLIYRCIVIPVIALAAMAVWVIGTLAAIGVAAWLS